VLEELTAGQPPLELLEREEVVVDAVLLAGARLARGRGDRQLKRQSLAQAPDQRPLADSRRPGYYEETQIARALATKE
jgi:hypothetical protein